jgi:hypothetical protein
MNNMKIKIHLFCPHGVFLGIILMIGMWGMDDLSNPMRYKVFAQEDVSNDGSSSVLDVPEITITGNPNEAQGNSCNPNTTSCDTTIDILVDESGNIICDPNAGQDCSTYANQNDAYTSSNTQSSEAVAPVPSCGGTCSLIVPDYKRLPEIPRPLQMLLQAVADAIVERDYEPPLDMQYQISGDIRGNYYFILGMDNGATDYYLQKDKQLEPVMSEISQNSALIHPRAENSYAQGYNEGYDTAREEIKNILCSNPTDAGIPDCQ